MITNDEFIKMLTFEQDVVLRLTSDLSQADSLLQPEPAGNCLNWVLGHLSVNLIDMITALDGELPPDLLGLDRYLYGSDPILGEGPGVLKVHQLLDTYAQLTHTLTGRLETMSSADFDEEIDYWQGKYRRGYVAFFYFFHHTYHIGQLEQLRNLAGRTEKVI